MSSSTELSPALNAPVPPKTPAEEVVSLADLVKAKSPEVVPVREIGGRKDGPEPTRYGDWEKNGRCIDF